MVTRDINPSNEQNLAPSLAERLSEIALFLADADDMGSLCHMLGQELGKLNLGAVLITPRISDPSVYEPAHVIYYLCKSSDPALQIKSEPGELFFPDDQPAVTALMQGMGRHNVLLSDFSTLIKAALPHAMVRHEDQGMLLPLTLARPGCCMLIIWGNSLRKQDVVPFSAFATMLGLAIRVIASTSRQQTQHQIEQETLLDISRILLQGSDLRVMLGNVAERVKKSIGSDLVTIHLYDAVEHCFTPYGAAGWEGEPIIPVPPEPLDEYPNGLVYVFHKRQPIIIDDELTEPRFGIPDFVTEEAVRSVVIVPILVGNVEVIGAIACSARQENLFTETDVRLLTLISNSTAQAIERIRLLQESQRRVDELSILYQVAQLANDASNEDELLKQVTHIIQQTLYSDEFGFVLFSEEKNRLLPHASYHAPGEANKGTLLPLDDNSVTGQVFATQAPQRISDVSQYSNYVAFIPGMRSELCVPLMAHNEILGVINAESYHPSYFSATDEQFLMTVSGQIATALQRTRHYTQEHRRGAQIENLRRATSTLAFSLDLQEVLSNTLTQLDSLIAFDSACIFLKEEHGLVAVAGKGFENLDEIIGHYFSADPELYGEIERTGQPLMLPDTRNDPRFHGWANTSSVRGWLGVPMKGRTQVIGYITIDSHRPDTFTENDAELTQPFADQAALVIENARAFESERRQLAMAQAQQEIGQLLTSQLDLSQVLKTILDVLNRVIPSDSASIMLVDENGQVSLSAERNLNQTPTLIEFVNSNIQVYSTKFVDDNVALIADTVTDPRWIQLSGNPVRSWVGAILTIQGTPIGLLNIDSHQPYTFDHSILPIVRSFADQAAVAIHNARMFDLTQQALNITEILYSTAHALIETTDLNSVVRIIASQSHSAVEADRVTVYLIDMPTEQVRQIMRSDGTQTKTELPDLLDGQALFASLNGSPEGESLRRRRPMLLASESEAPNRCVIVPLVFQETALGLIVAQNGPNRPEFTQRQLDLLMAIGNQAATAITSMQLFIALDAEKSQLELRVTERTQDLAQANDQLKELDRLKSEFIANVSHELRTPLTNIKLYLSLLSRNSSDSQKAHLSVLKEQTERLHQLIETVLDLSNLEASLEGEFDKNIPVELGRLIVSLIQEMQPSAEAKGIELEILALSNRAYVQGDRGLLTQAFENLILNALNYTPDHGSVTLQVRRDRDQVLVTITDTGVGIPFQEQPLIFDRFYRGRQAVDANISGTGLGLSIVKEIVERHRGQIEVNSELEKGSTFTVRLPSISEAP